MTRRAANTTYWFNRLPSRYEGETRLLEQAIASNCETLHNNLSAYREAVAFRRLPHAEKLERAMWHAARRLPGMGGEDMHALYARGNVPAVASTLAEWLGPAAAPLGWVIAIAAAEPGAATLSGRAAVDVMRCIKAFGRQVVDARSAGDLEYAGEHLIDAATLAMPHVLIGILLGQADVQVRRPVRSAVAPDRADDGVAKPVPL